MMESQSAMGFHLIRDLNSGGSASGRYKTGLRYISAVSKRGNIWRDSRKNNPSNARK
jgi:hypothetical protein